MNKFGITFWLVSGTVFGQIGPGGGGGVSQYPVGSGTVTSITTGCGLAGGTVTTTGTLSGTGPCWAAGGGTAQAQTATFSPAVTLTDGFEVCWKPNAANSGAAPTFAPNGLTAHTIVKAGGALVANDIITTAQACAIYNSTGTQWELQNPQTGGLVAGSSGQVIVNSGGSYTGVGTTPIAPATVQGAYNNLASNTNAVLSKLQIALANTRLGISDTKILLIGESTSSGQGGQFANTYPDLSSWPAFMKLGSDIPISTCGFSVATGNSRWTVPANWAGNTDLGFGSVGSFFGTVPVGGTTNTLVYKPNVLLANGLGCQDTFDSFDVYYVKNNFNAAVTLNMWCSGGGLTGSTTSVVMNTTNGSFKSTIACPQANTQNQLNATISGVQGALAFGAVTAAGAFNSQVARVRIDNAAQPGTTTGQWVSALSGKSLEHITAYAPDTAIIMLGGNDAIQSVPASTFAAHEQTLINTVGATGTILVTPVPPAANDPEQIFIPQYVSTGGANSMYGLADANGLPLIDIYKFLKGIGGPNWFRADNYHPTPTGYAAIGRFVGSALAPILGNYVAPVVNPNSSRDVKIIPFAAAPAGTSGGAVSYATGQWTSAARAGSNNLGGVLQAIPSTGAALQFELELPLSWDAGQQPSVNMFYGSGANTSGTVIWTISSACSKADGSITDDPAFVAESAFGSQAMGLTTNRNWSQGGTLTKVLSTNNCVPGGTMIIKAAVSGTAGSAINAEKAVVTIPTIPVAGQVN